MATPVLYKQQAARGIARHFTVHIAKQAACFLYSVTMRLSCGQLLYSVCPLVGATLFLCHQLSKIDFIGNTCIRVRRMFSIHSMFSGRCVFTHSPFFNLKSNPMKKFLWSLSFLGALMLMLIFWPITWLALRIAPHKVNNILNRLIEKMFKP